jgi:hypothetical protein
MLLQPSIAQLYEECRQRCDNGVLELQALPPVTLFLTKLVWFDEPRLQVNLWTRDGLIHEEIHLSRDANPYEDVRRLRTFLVRVLYLLRLHGSISLRTSSDSMSLHSSSAKGTSGSSPI